MLHHVCSPSRRFFAGEAQCSATGKAKQQLYLCINPAPLWLEYIHCLVWGEVVPEHVMTITPLVFATDLLKMIITGSISFADWESWTWSWVDGSGRRWNIGISFAFRIGKKFCNYPASELLTCFFRMQNAIRSKWNFEDFLRVQPNRPTTQPMTEQAQARVIYTYWIHNFATGVAFSNRNEKRRLLISWLRNNMANSFTHFQELKTLVRGTRRVGSCPKKSPNNNNNNLWYFCNCSKARTGAMPRRCAQVEPNCNHNQLYQFALNIFTANKYF